MAFGDDFTNPPPHDHSGPTGACCCSKGCPNLKEVIRSSMREEFQEFMKLLSPHLPSLQITTLPSTSRSVPNQAESPVSTLLQLHFLGVFPDTLFTLTDIEIDGAPLQVELRDSSGSRVEDGPGSSVKVKLYALSDMEEETEGWTEEDYNRNSVGQRKDKGALLVGDYEIPMRKGVAVFSSIRFTDNSSWTKTKKFKLAAVVKGLHPGVVVRGVVSKAFRVKERRGLACQKHKAPSLEDDVWHLVNIGKDGKTHQRLAKENVKTVKDFLQLYYTNAKKLQKILQVSEKKWTETVKHAANAGSCSGSSENCDVFSDSSVLFKGQIVQSCRILDSQKDIVDELGRNAYLKQNELPGTYDPAPPNLISLQAGPISSSTITHTNLQCYTPSCSSTITQTHAIAAVQGEQVLQVNSSPGLMQYSFGEHADGYLPGAATYEIPDLDPEMAELWAQLTGVTPQPEDGGARYDASASETVTSKLRVACFVNLAVTMFTSPVQQDHIAPRKKQKRQ